MYQYFNGLECIKLLELHKRARNDTNRSAGRDIAGYFI